MKKYQKIFKNQYIIMGIATIFLMIAIQGSYAFFMANFIGDKEVSLATKGFKFTYKEKSNSISITENIIVDDITGKASSSYFDFDVKFIDSNNRSVNYWIYLEEDIISTLDNSNVRVYLTDQTNTQVLTPLAIGDLDDYSEVANSKVLYTNSITSNGTETVHSYRLRVWIDENFTAGSTPSTSINGDEQSVGITPTTYKFKVGVSTVAPIPEPEPTIDTCFTFVTSGGESTITEYKCYAGNPYSMPTITDVVIPKKLGGNNVTIIADGTASVPIFRKVTSVVFPNTMRIIGEYSFSNNNLTGILTIPKNVLTIKQGAFANTTTAMSNKIGHILFEIGSKLETIGNEAFISNSLRGTITIPARVETIGNKAFGNSTVGKYNGNNQIDTLVFETSSQLITIGEYAFAENNLTGTLTIPKSLLTIKEGAFANTTTVPTNQISSLIFEAGSQLITIGNSAFYLNNLTGTVTIPASVVTIGDEAFGNKYNSAVFLNQLTSVVFEANSQLATIGYRAFYRNNIQGTVTIPASVTTIGNSAFEGTSISEGQTISNQISTLVFGAGSQLITIGEYAFFNNNIAGTVTIPANVTTIGARSFVQQSSFVITTMVNKTGRAFDWRNIIYTTPGTPFVTGIVNSTTVTAS